MMSDKRYTISIGDTLDGDLNTMARRLETTKSEVIRRALILFREALDADEVILRKGRQNQSVLVR